MISLWTGCKELEKDIVSSACMVIAIPLLTTSIGLGAMSMYGIY